MVYSDPNNTNSIAYQHTLLSYWLKASHWNISWAATLHLYNMADRGEKLQQPLCYHPFSDSRDTYLTKNHYENYSPKMVPTNPTGSWTIRNKLHWNFNQNSSIFIQENALEDAVCEMASILSRPQCVKGVSHLHQSIDLLFAIQLTWSCFEYKHCCACFSSSGGLHASGEIWP